MADATYTLSIKTDSGNRIDVSPEDDPRLYERFDAWKATPQRSGRERAAWDAVIEQADEYLDFLNDEDHADDVDAHYADEESVPVNERPIPAPDTPEPFDAIADELTRRGVKAESLDTGGNITCVLVTSASGAVYLFGTASETWGASIYADAEAYDAGDYTGEELSTPLPSSVLNPSAVVDAILQAIQSAEAEPAPPTNVQELLVAHGIAPTREDYAEFPLDSVCGRAVADIVTKADELIAITDPAVHASIRASVEHAAGIICFG